MKTRNALWSLLFAVIGTQAVAQAYGELDINDVRARFYAHGLIGQNLSTPGAAFEVPINGGAHPLFSAGLWVAGTTPDNQLRIAAMKYEALGEGDFYTGPLTNDGAASTNAAIMSQYDHVWSVTRAEVTLHTAYFQCLSDVNCDVAVEFPNGYTIPASILAWPAINTNPGYDTYLAPFYDFNGDGNYEPADGDAPCILGDQALYYVFNDNGGAHLLTNSQPIGLEIQAMPFAYTSTDPYLDQTIFVHYHIINRGMLTLENTRIGFFNDFDLGCYNDDFAGSDPGRNLSYVYNWDDTDESCGGATGYGTQPPAFGMVLLKGERLDPTGADEPSVDMLPAWNGTGFGDSVVDNERSGIDHMMSMTSAGASCCSDPVLAVHYWNYLSGIWTDGVTLTYGGDGYDPINPNAVPTHFSYPGSSDPVGVGTNGLPQAPWGEVEQLAPDRRTVTSLAPFTLEPGQHIDLLFAYVFARAESGGPLASVAALQTRVDSIRAFANTLPLWGFEEEFQGGCEGISQTGVEEVLGLGQLQLFPVPASDHVQLNALRALAGKQLTVHDATGRTVATHVLSQGLNDIDISSLSRGVYSYQVHTAKTHYAGKLVKE